MMSKQPLGKGLSDLGLDVLLSNPSLGNENNMHTLPLHVIDPDPLQPRQDFDPNMLSQLAESIRQHGVIQPIIVTPVGNRYVIVAGERRYRAAQMAGLKNVPVWSKQLSLQDRKIIALIENIQREDLNPIEQAQGMQRLLSEHNLTQQHLAEVLGNSRSHVTNMLRLLSLEEAIQEALIKKSIDFGHARTLVGLDQDAQLNMLKIITRRGLNVRQTEAWVRNDKQKKPQVLQEYFRVAQNGPWHKLTLRTEDAALVEALKNLIKQWDPCI